MYNMMIYVCGSGYTYEYRNDFHHIQVLLQYHPSFVTRNGVVIAVYSILVII